jgi:hypothetical protein
MPYNELIATTQVGLLVLAAACLAILVYLLLTKQVRRPQDVTSAAQGGNKLARAYVALFVLALLLFAAQAVLLILRGR